MKVLKYVASLFVLCSALISVKTDAFEILHPSKERYLKYTQNNRIYLAGLGGESYGCEKRYATGGYFLAIADWNQPCDPADCEDPCDPLECDQMCVPFIDLKAHYLDANQYAANAGVGVRWLSCCDSRVWGINIYYDYRNGCRGTYNGLALGIESLGLNFDVRINGYVPIAKTVFCHTSTFNYPDGGFISKCTRKEFSVPGLDLEVGRYIGPCRTYMLYTAIGAYYYYKSHFEHFVGVVGRLKIQYNDYLSLEVKGSYDKACRGKLQGAIQLTFPFEMFDCAYQIPRSIFRGLLLQPVNRKDVPVIGKCQKWKSNFGPNAVPTQELMR
jgi:hypothetical protein